MVSVTPPPPLDPHQRSLRTRLRPWAWAIAVCTALASPFFVHHAGTHLLQRTAMERFISHVQATAPSAEAYCPEYTAILDETLRDYQTPGRVVPDAARAAVETFLDGSMGIRVRIYARNGTVDMPKLDRDKKRIADFVSNIVTAQHLFGPLPHDFEFFYVSGDGPMLPRAAFPSPEGLVLPPLGYTTTAGHYDVSIPYTEQVILEEEASLARLTKLIQTHPWGSKRPQGIWRGSTTGGIVLDASNYWTLPRAMLVNISVQYPELVDARLTACKQCGPGIDQVFADAGFGYAPFVSYANQFQYQGLIDVDGHSWSSRFAQLLSINSVVYKQETEYVEFFRPLVKPWVHYIPIQKDFSDLVARLQETMGNEGNATVDWQLRNISAESTRLYRKSLVPSKQLCYLHRLLEACSNIYAAHQPKGGK